MNKKSSIEMERYKVIKTMRTLIRLKHSLNADEELNEALPDTLIEFDKAVQSGELLQITPPSLSEVLSATQKT